MKIGIVTSSYPLSPGDAYAAAGLFVRDLCLELVRQGHEVSVLTQNRPGEQVSDPGITVIRFPWLGSSKRPADLRISNPADWLPISSFMVSGLISFLVMTRRCRLHGAVALWVLPSGLWTLAAFWLLGLPYLVWTLGSDVWVYGQKRWSKAILRMICDKAKAIFSDGIALSHETQKFCARPVRFLASSRVLPRTGLSPIVLTPSKKHLLFVGRFHVNKGPDLLVEALALIPPDDRNKVHVTMIGGGELEEKVRSLLIANELSDLVTLIGYGDALTVASYLNVVDALVIPSRIESIPVVFSDAIQMNCPVVATDVGDMGTLLRQFPGGLIVQPTPESIANGIQAMIKREKASFSGAINQLQNIFNLSQTARVIIDELDYVR